MMKRRSFLALLGLAPLAPLAAKATPADDGWRPMSSIVPFKPFMPDRSGWSYDMHASVWIHTDHRFVTAEQLVQDGMWSPEEYCALHGVKVARYSGDYVILSNGKGMHLGFPERITHRHG